MKPRILYLHGFASGPGSKKARYFSEKLKQLGLGLETPDLTGGDFAHLTISSQLQIIARETGGQPCRLIGSSMGGYLAALVAARSPAIEKLVLLAPAFGFARRWPQRLGDEKMAEWERSGWLPVFHYGDQAEREVWFQLIEDGRRYEDFPQVRQPCLIYHGRRDDVVPVEQSIAYAASRPNVELHVVDSGHELTDVLDLMWERIRDFLV